MQTIVQPAENAEEQKQTECTPAIPINIISTVGKTDEPILKVLKEYSVRRAFFLVSGESKMEQILALTEEKGVESCVETVKDAENINECYLACKRLFVAAGAKTEPQNILLNYTGGTKTMAAASVLAASDFGISSIYVGGEQRDGAGRVITGFEKIVQKEDTKKILLVEEKRNALYFFNNGQYETAEKIAKDAARNAAGNTKETLELMAKLASVYAQWDLFKHDRLDVLKSILRRAEEYKETTGLELVPLTHLSSNVEFYEKLSKRGNSKPKEIVADLLANAKRRLDHCKYDDAVARFYRCLEMLAQSILLEKHGIDTSHLRPEQIPADMHFPKGTNQIALTDSYKLLIALKDPVGRAYQSHEAELKEILFSRNTSILAHGSTPIKQKTAEKFCEILEKFASAADLRFEDYPGAAFCKFSEIPDEISDK